jgi:hypothetical protein
MAVHQVVGRKARVNMSRMRGEADLGARAVGSNQRVLFHLICACRSLARPERVESACNRGISLSCPVPAIGHDSEYRFTICRSSGR